MAACWLNAAFEFSFMVFMAQPPSINKYSTCLLYTSNNRYLTIGLLTGFIVGGCMGVLGWAFLQNLFAIPICAGIGMLIGCLLYTSRCV